ncbi:uncharacterized protein LOC110037714, partial [Phalaenopsis equestris]|uniref:uncharacterized protein LOC110037714 n=1 Tax=Phalaenopsis equestris TaxID=78828 RepID=UPI0009E386DE
FPKGPRSTRAVRPPLSPILKFKQVSGQLIYGDVDLQDYPPVHKKRGVDRKSSKEFYLEESSEIALANSYQSKIENISRKRKLSHILTGKNNSKLSSSYTPERPLLTFSFLLNNGLLERLLLIGMKDKLEPFRCIKDIGTSYRYSARCLKKQLADPLGEEPNFSVLHAPHQARCRCCRD